MSYFYKDMQLGKGSALYELVVTDKRKDQKAVDKAYEQSNKSFLKTYPQCNNEWFERMNQNAKFWSWQRHHKRTW